MRKSKQPTKKATSISLLNGCYYTGIKVTPQNWETPKADITKTWYIWYRFTDPSQKEHPVYTDGVRQVSMKGGNHLHTLTERRNYIKGLIEEEREMIEDRHYNPITECFMTPSTSPDYTVLSPTTPFIKALEEVLKHKSANKGIQNESERVKESDNYINMKSVLKYIKMAAIAVDYDKIPIKDISKFHIRHLLEETGKIKQAIENKKRKHLRKEVWTNNNYNSYRAHLMMFYTELDDWGAVDNNPVEKIKIKEHVPEERETLTEEQRQFIDKHLHEHHYEFWIFLNIFFLAGCRITEIMTVQGKDVDLENQKFKALRKKGQKVVVVDYVITNTALKYWRLVLENCKPEQYVFSKGLVPGDTQIDSNQITRRWKRHIKDKFEITADFYSLKHLQTTMTRDLIETTDIGRKIAASFNNESETMIDKHYDTKSKARRISLLRNIPHEFVSKSS